MRGATLVTQPTYRGPVREWLWTSELLVNPGVGRGIVVVLLRRALDGAPVSLDGNLFWGILLRRCRWYLQYVE